MGNVWLGVDNDSSAAEAPLFEFARMLSHHDRSSETRSVCRVWYEGAQKIRYTLEVDYAVGGLYAFDR